MSAARRLVEDGGRLGGWWRLVLALAAVCIATTSTTCTTSPNLPQPAAIRGGAFRAAPTGRRRLPVGHVADHGAAHSSALARSDAPARHGRRPLVPDPAPESVRRPGRPLPRGLLLGLVLHDARAHRERPHRSREEHAR